MNFKVAKCTILCYFVIFISLEVVTSFKNRKPIHGLYTKDIEFYQLLVPYKINSNGDIETFFLPQYFQHDYQSKRIKRDLSHPDLINYNLYFNDKDHHIQLWPNHGFISPDVISEFHYPGSEKNVKIRKYKRLNQPICQYTGKIKNDHDSSVALSLCDGLAGYIKTRDGVYLIEPVEDFIPNEYGHQLHVIHKTDTRNNYHNMNKNKNIKEKSKNCAFKDSNFHTEWKNAFKKHFEQIYSNNNNNNDKIHSRKSIRTIKKQSDIKHQYLEVLVVADKKFLDFHKDKDYENYIMTVMNMVSDYFHDASLTHQYDVTVVRIIYLDENLSSIDLDRTKNANTILKSFCRWQCEINPKDIEHPQHHDIAILITRNDICSMEENENCDLLGLAYLASACMPSDACAINEDKGLILGVVIAHEIGHIMGCEHDSEDTSGCPEMVNEKFYYVMSPHINLAATIWSSCSKAYMEELLKNNLGDCLNDEPAESSFKYDEILPGIVYDADYQCNLIYPNSTNCKIPSDKFCEKLYCRVSKNRCWTNNEPPAEGTKCAANKWCSKQKCVPLGQRLEAIDGGWTEWGKYSSCSRTCGGGIQISERSCTNPTPFNGGLYCQGLNKRYKICNTQSCPIKSPSFRALQCSEFDRIPKNGKFHEWKPYFPIGINLENTCALYCVNEENVYSKLLPRVEDGTPCRGGTNDMCIAGICRKVGCDWELDSEAINDHCGVCNGNDTCCTRLHGRCTGGEKGLFLMTTIPKGVRNVLISEDEPSDNCIAVTDDHRNFFLRPGELDGEKRFGKNIAFYIHSIQNREELYIVGPLYQALLIYIAFNQPKNVGFSWEYYVRDKSCTSNKKKCGKNNYHWEFIDWSMCSAKCDGGLTKSKPHCVSQIPGGIVNAKFCSNIPKPENKIKSCNKRPCKIRWHTGEWTACSGCKHKPGVKFRRVWCAEESPRWDENDIITDDEKCISLCEEIKPKTRQLCVGECSDECNERPNRDISLTKNYIHEDYNKLDKRFFQNYYKNIDFIDLDDNALIIGKAHIWTNLNMPEKFTRGLAFIDLNKENKHIKKDISENLNLKAYKNNLNFINGKKIIIHLIKNNSIKNSNNIYKLKNKLFISYDDDIEKNKRQEDEENKKKEQEKEGEGGGRNIQDSMIMKSNHEIVNDFHPKRIIVEIPYSKSKITKNNLTDEAYQKYGDKIAFGTIDLVHHTKVLKDKNAICHRVENLQNITNFEDNDEDNDDDAVEQDPTDNVDIPSYTSYDDN